MAARGITIRWFASHYRVADVNVIDGVRVRIEAECAIGMDSKVFAYRMLPLSPKTGEAVGHFSHVCSPPDLAEFPEDEPLVGYAPEWFRLAYVDVLIRSMEEAEDFINIVRADLRSLKKTLDRMDTVVPGGAEVIGAACPVDPGASSDSLSSSSASSESIGAQQELCAVGTTEQATGFGTDWVEVGEGAGTPIGVSDSMGANYQRTTLVGGGVTSKLLLIQGFDLDELPDDAIVDGIALRLVLRDATELLTSLSASSTSSASSIGAGDVGCPRLRFLALQHPLKGLGTNKAMLECVTGPEWQTILAGGADDTWGFETLRGADLKRGEFGLSLILGNDEEVDLSVLDVDGAELCIYYRNVY